MVSENRVLSQRSSFLNQFWIHFWPVACWNFWNTYTRKIKALLPHRGDMILVHAFSEKSFIQNSSFVTLYEVPHRRLLMPGWLKGHFPDDSIMPGVMITENAAQSAILLMKFSRNPEFLERLPRSVKPQKDFLFARIKDIKFTKCAKPGNWLFTSVKLIDSKKAFHTFSFETRLDSMSGDICASGTFLGVSKN